MTTEALRPYLCHEPPPLLNVAGLPVPRLELAFADKPTDRGYLGLWFHRLVLQHLEGYVHTLVLAVTRVEIKPEQAFGMPPFRSSSSIRWDAAHLGVPTFLVVGREWRPFATEPDDRWLAKVRELNREQMATPEE